MKIIDKLFGNMSSFTYICIYQLINNKNKIMANGEQITLNGVTLEIHRYDTLNKGKINYEIYTKTISTKMFITESAKTGKNTFISVWINGYNIKLSPTYDYGYALHIFTDLINQFNK